MHAGVDLAAPSGTPVYAVGAGRVVSAGSNHSGYGISVVLDHGNGYLTHYAHLSSRAVRPGQRVVARQRIGAEGSTGDSTGPHLHFEVHRRVWRNTVEPTDWLRARGIDVGCGD
ncbi:MAG TPA: M23 family metallopeptidase [Catenuloplanes sp.]|jgi:murein DD-endopeptidase MepM/ murein hydrolase activator NlpD